MTRTGNISNLLFWLDDDVGLPLLGRGVLEHLWLSHRSACWQKAFKDGQDGSPPLQHHPALQGPRQCPQVRRQALYWERGPPSNYGILRMPTAVSVSMSLCFSLSLSFSLLLYLSLSCSEDLVAVAPWWLATWPWSSARRLTLQMILCAQSKLQRYNLTLLEARGQSSLGRQTNWEAFAFTWAEHRRISQKSARHTEKSPRWKII